VHGGSLDNIRLTVPEGLTIKLLINCSVSYEKQNGKIYRAGNF